MHKLIWIGLGGGAGSMLRYLMAGWVLRLAGTTFPVGTMFVNVSGCLTIGILGAIFAGPHSLREEWKWALMIGVLGGYTTFSTFSFETLELANDGQWLRVAINVVITNAACLAAVWIGYRLTERLIGT